MNLAFDRCMAKLNEMDKRLDGIITDDAKAVTPEFIWFWMFCVPAGSFLVTLLVIAVCA